MIPKVIHYCWISGDKKPKEIERCIESWHKNMPNYEVKCWNRYNIEACSIPYVEEAISVKKYAFAADYIRLFVLYTEGGIYLDSDVEVLRPFDVFLENHFFCGTEAFYAEEAIKFRMKAAIMGSLPGHPFLKECMQYYESRHFIHDNGDYDNKYCIMPQVISNIANTKYKYNFINEEQLYDDGIKVYSTRHFCNNLCYDKFFTSQTYAVHRNAESWMPMEHRGWLFHFCRKHNLMDLYNKLEHLKR